MRFAQNDNERNTRIPAPLWRDGGYSFALTIVLVLGLLSLWRGGAFD